MDLSPNAGGADFRLRVEERVPPIQRDEQEVVGRRLRLRAGRGADRLKHRIGVRKIDNAIDDDGCVRKPRAMDRDAVARGDVKIGRRLLGDKDTLALPEQRADIAWEAGNVVWVDAEHLPGS